MTQLIFGPETWPESFGVTNKWELQENGIKWKGLGRSENISYKLSNYFKTTKSEIKFSEITCY